MLGHWRARGRRERWVPHCECTFQRRGPRNGRSWGLSLGLSLGLVGGLVGKRRSRLPFSSWAAFVLQARNGLVISPHHPALKTAHSTYRGSHLPPRSPVHPSLCFPLSTTTPAAEAPAIPRWVGLGPGPWGFVESGEASCMPQSLPAGEFFEIPRTFSLMTYPPKRASRRYVRRRNLYGRHLSRSCHMVRSEGATSVGLPGKGESERPHRGAKLGSGKSRPRQATPKDFFDSCLAVGRCLDRS